MVAIILNLNSCKRHLPTSVIQELFANQKTHLVIPAVFNHDPEKPWKGTYQVNMKSFYNTVMDYIKTSINKQILQKKRERYEQIVSFTVPLRLCEEKIGDLAELH